MQKKTENTSTHLFTCYACFVFDVSCLSLSLSLSFYSSVISVSMYIVQVYKPWPRWWSLFHFCKHVICTTFVHALGVCAIEVRTVEELSPWDLTVELFYSAKNRKLNYISSSLKKTIGALILSSSYSDGPGRNSNYAVSQLWRSCW